jgi:hypothetical protein
MGGLSYYAVLAEAGHDGASGKHWEIVAAETPAEAMSLAQRLIPPPLFGWAKRVAVLPLASIPAPTLRAGQVVRDPWDVRRPGPMIEATFDLVRIEDRGGVL